MPAPALTDVSKCAHIGRTLAICVGITASYAYLPSPAVAASAPPGNAAVQEFVESLPDGSGLRTTNDVSDFRGEALRTGRVVTERTRRVLTKEGREGQAIVSLAEASGPQPSASDGGVPGRGQPALTAATERVVGGSGPGGMGAFLPITFALGVVAGCAYAMRRRGRLAGAGARS